jgi:hypothetical protein
LGFISWAKGKFDIPVRKLQDPFGNVFVSSRTGGGQYNHLGSYSRYKDAFSQIDIPRIELFQNPGIFSMATAPDMPRFSVPSIWWGGYALVTA